MVKPLNTRIATINKSAYEPRRFNIEIFEEKTCEGCTSVICCEQLWGAENLECGVWKRWDYADNLEDALSQASSLTWDVREEWIRIVTPDNKIL